MCHWNVWYAAVNMKWIVVPFGWCFSASIKDTTLLLLFLFFLHWHFWPWCHFHCFARQELIFLESSYHVPETFVANGPWERVEFSCMFHYYSPVQTHRINLLILHWFVLWEWNDTCREMVGRRETPTPLPPFPCLKLSNDTSRVEGWVNRVLLLPRGCPSVCQRLNCQPLPAIFVHAPFFPKLIECKWQIQIEQIWMHKWLIQIN